jgi:pimeloyl-ACP methyl ester carboxylesterase
MPYTKNNGVRIYYDVEGDGPPLLLMHGLGGHTQQWREAGYIDSLRSSYRCIIPDARGHGRSDRPHEDEMYSRALQVGDITCVLDDLDIEDAHFWGYSMGAQFGQAAMSRAGDRFASYILGGTNLRTRPGDPAPLLGLLARGRQAVLDALLPPEMHHMFDGLDVEALAAMVRGLNLSDSESPLVAEVPVLVYNGGADPAQQALAPELPANVQTAVIGGLSHPIAFMRSDLVLPVVLPFLEEVARSSGVS